jgi:tyrosine-protein kinase Etk/Wzc
MAERAIDVVEAAESYTHVSPAGEVEEDSIDLVALMQTLVRGKRTIFAASLVALAIAASTAFLLPLRYTSTVSFIPPNLNNNNSIATALAGQLSALGATGLIGSGKTSGDLYAGVLASRSVVDELIERFDLKHVYRVKKQSQAEKQLASDTAVAVDVKSSIVTVSVTEKSPALARDLGNAYMDALRRTDGRLALGESSQRRLFFGQQLVKEKDDLEDAEVELKKTEEQSGLIAPAGQTESEIKTIAETRGALSAREVQLAALRESGTEQSAAVVRMQSEIADLQGQLARLQNGSGKGSIAAIPTSRVPQLQLEYVRKEREVKYHEALFDMLSKQYEAARLDEAHDAPVLQVLDSASYPDTKSSPKRAYIMLGGLVLGFFAGCAWVLARDPIRALRASLAPPTQPDVV